VQHTDPFGVLGMYPFPTLRPAWEQLYTSVAERVRGAGHHAPSRLRWDLDPHDSWLDPDLAIGMTCGWPLVTSLREQVRVVGTFSYRTEPAPRPHLYRTVIVARPELPMGALLGRRAAINSTDSLSGHISLLAAFGLGEEWPGEVVLTGAHVRSLEAVRTGAADVASIDGMTWEYQRRDEPSAVDGLCVVGHGPWVPGLPVILPASAPDAALEAWRAAFIDAIAAGEAPDELLIEAFVPLSLADYDNAVADLIDRHEPGEGQARLRAGRPR
jgi:ABC-type phosphate/phosphonate transport system substrate-binding protein